MKCLLFTALILIFRIGMAQVKPQEILFLPWEVDSLGSIAFSLDPEGRVGPQNFQVEGDTVYLLNQQNSAINIYTKQQMIDQLPVERKAKDFQIRSNDDYICLADNGLEIYKNRNLTEQIPSSGPLPIIRKIEVVNDQILAVNHDGTISEIADRRLVKSSSPGILDCDLQKESRSRAKIIIRDASGTQSGQINLSFDGNDLGSFSLIGTDKIGRIFLDIDLIVQEVPLKVRREVWILNSIGEQIGKITIPTHYFTMMWNDLRLDERGILYHMLSGEDGIHIFRWNFSEKTADFFEGAYPEIFQKYLHYNDAISAEPELLEKKSPVANPAAVVTRSQALVTADTYAVHEWTCIAANLTGTAGVTAPDGLLIITPAWIESGENIRIPYKWGGFSTLSQFDAGLLAGKYAGDKYTSKSSGSSYAVGVDCSGFVSRCWNLSSHYSTRMMPTITTAYSSWDSLKAGDAIHKEGHVRLAVENLANGSILAVEAAGSSTDWRVNYRTYTYSALSDYTPRYYINMTGPALAMAQPVFISTREDDSQASLNWSLGSVDNVSGIQIQYSEDGIIWNALLGDSLLDPAMTEFSSDWSAGPVYLRLKSINNEESAVVESLPSDTYGFYTAANCDGKVLIVDGFDRASGSWGLPYHTFAQWMGENLADLGISFETVANEAVISGSVVLSDYKAVYWILGDESTGDETFSSVEQTVVANYLNSGGRLFVSGSEIGWDLDNQGGTADKTFFLNYLHADFIQDDAGDYTVTGTAGGIFAGLAFEYDDGSVGIYEEDYPDVIAPMLNATTCLEYSSGVAAGIQYAGTFGSGTLSGQLVYLSFPWETVTNSADRLALLKNISEWFGFNCSGIDIENPLMPGQANLSHGYPNPFNSRITFHLILPDYADFEVAIYNSCGQLVRHLEKPQYGNLEYNILWDGRNDFGELVASGCYFLQVETGSRILTEKAIFLK